LRGGQGKARGLRLKTHVSRIVGKKKRAPAAPMPVLRMIAFAE